MKNSKQQWWRVILISGFIPLTFIFGTLFDVPQRFTIPVVIIIILICGSMSLWIHANMRETENAWWQDDNASGWRGY